jgi:hypothetical protein
MIFLLWVISQLLTTNRVFPMAHLSRMGSKGRLAEWLKWLVNDGYVNNDGWLMRNGS